MIKIFYDDKRSLFLIMLSIITPIFLILMNYELAETPQVLGSENKTDMDNNQNLVYPSIPSNISVVVEPKNDWYSISFCNYF